MGRLGLVAREELNTEEIVPTEADLEIVSDAKAEEIEAEHAYEVEAENIQRSLDIGVGLENLYAALEGKVEFTPTEIRLARIATEMAVAGTGLSANAVMPSLEGLAPSLALEGISDKLGSILNKIVDSIKSVTRSIVAYVKKVIFTMRSYEGQIKVVRELIQKRMAEGKKSVKEYEAKPRSLFVVDKNHKTVSSVAELGKEMAKLTERFEDMTTAFVKHAKIIESDYGMFRLMKDLAKVEETAKLFFGNTMDLAQGLIKDLRMKKSGQLRGADEFVTEPLLTGVEIAIRVPSKDRNDLTDYATMKSVATMFGADTVHLNPVDGLAPSVVFKNIKLDDLDKMIDHSSNMLSTTIMTYEKLVDILENAAVHLEQSVDSIVAIVATYGSLIATSLSAKAVKALNAGEVTAGNVMKVGGSTLVGAGVQGGYQIFRSTVFSYRMMSINNAFLFQLIRTLYFVPGEVLDQTMLFTREVLSRADWE